MVVNIFRTHFWLTVATVLQFVHASYGFGLKLTDDRPLFCGLLSPSIFPAVSWTVPSLTHEKQLFACLFHHSGRCPCTLKTTERTLSEAVPVIYSTLGLSWLTLKWCLRTLKLVPEGPRTCARFQVTCVYECTGSLFQKVIQCVVCCFFVHAFLFGNRIVIMYHNISIHSYLYSALTQFS